MNQIRNLSLFAFAALLVGCSQDAAPQLEPEKPQVAEPVSVSSTSENGMLTVDPAVIDLCSVPDGIVAADVSWDASSTGTTDTQVWLDAPDEDKKLWVAAGASSQARTGQWLRDGSKVILIGKDDEQLAEINIRATPCVK